MSFDGTSANYVCFLHQAQAIMLLAGESCLVDPPNPTTPTSGVPPRCPNSPLPIMHR